MRVLVLITALVLFISGCFWKDKKNDPKSINSIDKHVVLVPIIGLGNQNESQETQTSESRESQPNEIKAEIIKVSIIGL